MAPARKIPEFDDYHRTVIGYHGTRRSTALQIVQGLEPYTFSTNRDDWLGNGVYFWEYGPQQAWVWAERRRQQKVKAGEWSDSEEIAVLASMIRLGHCLDLLDPQNTVLLKECAEQFQLDYELAEKTPPENAHTHRYLDCAIFEHTYAWLKEQGLTVDTCRACYIPTDRKKRVWNRSWIYEGSHIQLCVRNPRAILGTWLVPPVQKAALNGDFTETTDE